MQLFSLMQSYSYHLDTDFVKCILCGLCVKSVHFPLNVLVLMFLSCSSERILKASLYRPRGIFKWRQLKKTHIIWPNHLSCFIWLCRSSDYCSTQFSICLFLLFPFSALNKDRTLNKQTLSPVYSGVWGENAGEKCVANMWFAYSETLFGETMYLKWGHVQESLQKRTRCERELKLSAKNEP